MAFEGDPHVTLGVPAGASQAEIKAAYRRLAKAFHPDTAGEAAIPRFLAIQAAYETLTGTTVRPRRATEAWRADAERARAAREGTREGAREGTREGWRGRAAPGSRPRRAHAAGSSRSEARSDAGTRPRPRRGAPNRPPDRATPGSTTYDAAEGEPFDPEWSGASWYGTTSGTYWTINPKEYADPRKHGPEYQARGRRRPAGGPNPTEAAAADAEETAAEPREEEPVAWAANAAAAGGPPPASRPRQGAWVPPTVPLRGRTSRRVALALIGWPPLGVIVAAVIGEATGCSRFAAGCDENIGITVWLAQLVLIGLLLAIPRLAAISTLGTIAALAAAVPATLLLSVSGGAQERAVSVTVLTSVLAVAYIAGFVFGAVGGSRTLRT
jgi:DnaJ domain